MEPLGQFALVGEPNRFVWIRGFDDMAARFRGLNGFYGGAFWQAHRDEANAMMREHHDVHLLRPLGSIDALTGLALEDRASEPPGTLPPHTGLVVVDFNRTDAGALGRLVDAFERVQPTLLAHGHQILGHFVAELTPNDYPRLPVIQDPALLVVLSAYRDREHHARLTTECRTMGTTVTAEVTTLSLRPTARSVIRYQPPGPGRVRSSA